MLNRIVRNPYLRPIPPSLYDVRDSSATNCDAMAIPSSFSSALGASSAGADPPAAAAPPEGAAAAAPPPDPTFKSMSLTFFPSSA
jgi:hypothetical protein